MLTKTALKELTQAVSSRIRQEVFRYNQKVSESVTQEDLRDQFLNKIDFMGKSYDALHAWNFLEEHYPPIFTELLSCLREDRKLDRLEFPCSYNLHEIVRPEVERLIANVEEFDSDSLLTEQLFEKIYPMLVEAKYIHFESEKYEPVFDLNVPSEEVPDLNPDSEEEEMFDPPFASSGNENSIPLDAPYDEGDWE